MTDEKIRIMHLVNYLGLAGMEYGVIKLANRLAAKGFESLIVSLNGKEPGIEEIIDPRVKLMALTKRPGLDLWKIWRVARMQRAYKPHIVHSHNWGTYPYAVIAQHIHRAPCFIHGEHGRDTAQWRLSRGQRWFIAATLRKVHCFTTVAQHLANDICNIWGVAPNRVFAIPNGVELAKYQINESRDAIRESIGVSSQSIVLGAAAATRPVKDFATLLAASAHLAREGRDIVLLVASALTPDKAIADKFMAKSRELCAPARVIFLGSRKDIPRLMRAFDVYVNSSVFEGMSNMILEAMASGCPIVASDIPGNREILAEGRFKNLFPVGQPQILAERISYLVDNDEAREKLVQAQLKHVKESFASEIMVERYAQFYRNVAGRKPSA